MLLTNRKNIMSFANTVSNLIGSGQKIKRTIEETKPEEIHNNLADVYLKADEMIKRLGLDMKEKTDILGLDGKITASVSSNVGTVPLTLPSEIFTGFIYIAEYSITGAPTSYNIKAPFDSIQWEIKDKNGSINTYTFNNDAIVKFQKYMIKSQTFKDQLGETYAYKRNATETTIIQTVILPVPAYLTDAPQQIISEMLLPIRREKASKLKITFYNTVDQWCEFNGGTSPAIALTSVPEIRYSYLSSVNTRANLFKYYGDRDVPVWTVEDLDVEFSPSSTSYSKELVLGAITSDVKFAGTLISLYETDDGTTETDTAQMQPIRIRTSGELGLYKGKTMVLTGTSNALQLRTLNTFNTLASEGVSNSTYKVTPIFVSSASPFNISHVARDYINIGSATNFKIKLPNIENGLTSGHNYLLHATIFEITSVRY